MNLDEPSCSNYLAVYGSLMNGLNPSHQPDFSDHLDYVGPVLIPGKLYLVKEGSYPYPGLSLLCEPEDASVHEDLRTATGVRGELFKIRKASVIQRLDAWEQYSPGDRAGSPYVRRLIRTLEPEVDAWVYVGNHTDRSELIAGGDWRRFTARNSDSDERTVRARGGADRLEPADMGALVAALLRVFARAP